jgi:RND family efflux transporter MFP subunit
MIKCALFTSFVLAASALHGVAGAAEPAPPVAKPIVVIARAAAAPASAELLLPGTIEAWQETQINARISGYVARWHADIGDTVGAGELLVEIDAPEIDQALAAARAEREQAAANLDIARTTYERWQALVERKTVAEHDVDERRAVFAARKADLLAADAKVNRLTELSGFKRVVAPFAGTITKREVETGQLIDAGGRAKGEMYRVAETERLRIRVGVPQANLRAIRKGLPATVLVAEYPGRRFDGTVVRTAGAIDPATRTLLTEVELPNPDGTLLPGLYAQVRFELPFAGDTVLVPTNAVRIDAKGAHVATVDDAQRVRLRPVELGRNLGTQVEVLHGLPPGAAVVLNPTDLLQDGLEVLAKEPPVAGT